MLGVYWVSLYDLDIFTPVFIRREPWTWMFSVWRADMLTWRLECWWYVGGTSSKCSHTCDCLFDGSIAKQSKKNWSGHINVQRGLCCVNNDVQRGKNNNCYDETTHVCVERKTAALWFNAYLLTAAVFAASVSFSSDCQFVLFSCFTRCCVSLFTLLLVIVAVGCLDSGFY